LKSKRTRGKKTIEHKDEASQDSSVTVEETKIDLARKFAKELARQTISDPNVSNSRTSTRYSLYSRDNILTWLQSPTQYEKNLRDASNYMYIYSMQYRRLINDYADMLKWAYVISPLNFNSAKVNKESFKKQYIKVSNTLELMNIPDEMRKIVCVALRDGAYFGVRWLDSTSSFIQKLNPDNCQITHISDGAYLFSFNMSKLDESKLVYYPPQFESMWRDYQSSGLSWQPVPADIAVCLKADPSVPDYSIPIFAATMPKLYTIANAESLQETASELSNYKMITGMIPLDDEGTPKLDYNLSMDYYKHLANAVGENVGVAVTPFELKSFNFEQSAGVADVDNIMRSIQHFWTSAGTSALLHGAPNNTAGVVKLAIKNDESLMFSMMKQCERLINRYLKTQMSGTYKFKITFLPITEFNYDEQLSRYKEAINYGIGKSYYLAALGIPQYDVEGLDFIEDEVLNIDELLTPLRSSSTMSGESEEGRPEMDETDLGDSGASTRDNDTNANR